MSYLTPDPIAARRRKLYAAGIAVLMTVIVMTAFLIESRSGYLPPDTKIVFAQSWRADRTGEDALAERAAVKAAAAVELAQSRAYIATLPAAERTKAQAQYDAYVEGKGLAGIPGAIAGN